MDRNRSTSDELAEKTRVGDDSPNPTGQELLDRNQDDDESPDDAERSEGSDVEPREAASP